MRATIAVTMELADGADLGAVGSAIFDLLCGAEDAEAPSVESFDDFDVWWIDE